MRRIPLFAGSFANHLWQALVGPHNRGGEVPTRNFHLRVDPPVPLTTADIHAELTHVELTSMHRSGAKGSLVDPIRRSLQNAGYRLPRILLLRGWVNKGKKAGRDLSRIGGPILRELTRRAKPRSLYASPKSVELPQPRRVARRIHASFCERAPPPTGKQARAARRSSALPR